MLVHVVLLFSSPSWSLTLDRKALCICSQAVSSLFFLFPLVSDEHFSLPSHSRKGPRVLVPMMIHLVFQPTFAVSTVGLSTPSGVGFLAPASRDLFVVHPSPRGRPRLEPSRSRECRWPVVPALVVCIGAVAAYPSPVTVCRPSLEV